MPPLTVGGELDLVHGQEVHPPVEGHRLDGADVVGGTLRDDALLAGDEGDRALSLEGGHPIVVLSGEQAQKYFSNVNDEYPAVPGVALAPSVAALGIFRPDAIALPWQITYATPGQSANQSIHVEVPVLPNPTMAKSSKNWTGPMI